jgi:hypothetical protein
LGVAKRATRVVRQPGRGPTRSDPIEANPTDLRQIAKEVGVAETTVRVVLEGARKRKPSVSAQPGRAPTRSDLPCVRTPH